MKRITASLLIVSALSASALISAPAMAESPVDRSMHSWDYVQQVANPPAPQEAPVVDRHENRPYYHHEAQDHKGAHGKHGMKHHHAHAGKHHEGTTKHKHHHHHTDAKKDTTAPAKDQPKQ